MDFQADKFEGESRIVPCIMAYAIVTSENMCCTGGEARCIVPIREAIVSRKGLLRVPDPATFTVITREALERIKGMEMVTLPRENSRLCLLIMY
jgi:hypothetical protein